MGSIKKMLAEIKLPNREDHQSRMFIDLAENIHIHHREFRQIFSLNEFFEYTDIVKKSEFDVRSYLSNNTSYKEHEYPTTLLIAGGKERQLKFLKNSPKSNQSYYMDRDMAIELQEEFVTDEIHIHYRDFRISLDRKTFKVFAECVTDAKKQLELFETKNTYVRKSHSDRVIKEFNKNDSSNNSSIIMGSKEIECTKIRSKHFKNLILDWEPNSKLIKKIIEQIKLNDLIPPIILSKEENGIYHVIDGHHRLYAHLKINKKKINSVITNLTFEETSDIREAMNLLTKFDLKNNFQYNFSDYFKSFLGFKLNNFYKDDYSQKIKKNTKIYKVLRSCKYFLLGKASYFKNYMEKHNKK